MVKYARQMVNFFYFSYLGSKQFRPGIEYLDSLNDAPFLQQHCKHELLSARAGLHQMCGDNEAAIRLADEYLQLPEYDDADRYIPQAELSAEFISIPVTIFPKLSDSWRKRWNVTIREGNSTICSASYLDWASITA